MCLQAQKAKLEGAYRVKDELLAMRETEVWQIPLLRAEVDQLKVRTHHSLHCGRKHHNGYVNVGK